MRSRQRRRSATDQVGIRREAGNLMGILRDRGKIEAIATVVGVDLPVLGLGFLPALFGTGVGVVAIPLEILLQTCIPLGAEAPSQTLRISQTRENMGAKGNQEQQSTERRRVHSKTEHKLGKKVNATL